MASKLKGLKVEKVDFVDEGANPDAHIRMLKRKDDGENGASDTGNVIKKLFSMLGKAVGMNQHEINNAIDEIQKGDSVSFSEKFNERKNQKIADEIWDICYALQTSLCSILNDGELDSSNAEAAMKKSLAEFNAVIADAITEWSDGKAAQIVMKNAEVSEAELEAMESAVERLTATIDKVKRGDEPAGTGPNNEENLKGEEEEMKIDKSKLTPAERDFLESIEKRCGVEEENTLSEGASAVQMPAEPAVIKSAQAKPEETPAQQADAAEDIYKGLHPAVAAELAELKKFKDAAEDRELSDIAKKYAIIGKTEEELVPLFKSLKEAGGTAYGDMIAVLDQTVNTVEKSGAFYEVGKSGHGSSDNSAQAKIDGIAKKYMESDPSLSYQKAIAKAWESNPDCLAEYDEQEGF